MRGPSGGSSPICSRASSIACRASASMVGVVRGRAVDAESGLTPRSRYLRSGAMPEASRMFEEGQWQTPVPLPANNPISSSLTWTAWAYQTSSPTQSSVSM